MMTSTDCKYPSASRVVRTRGQHVRAPVSLRSTACINVLAISALLGSCHWPEPFVEPHVVPDKPTCRVMGLACAPDCTRYYNNGQSDRWAACMGVPLR